MRIYPGKLQKRINIYPHYFYPFRHNTEKKYSIGINPGEN